MNDISDGLNIELIHSDLERLAGLARPEPFQEFPQRPQTAGVAAGCADASGRGRGR